MHKHLNIKEHKEEFEMRNLTVMSSNLVEKRWLFTLIFTATATIADSTGRIFHLENIGPTKSTWAQTKQNSQSECLGLISDVTKY